MRAPLFKRLLARIQATLTAAAFAEESDVETARRIAKETEPSSANRGKPR
jgi:hypothetical protein